MKCLVFGANGQVGRALRTYDGVVALSRKQADLTDFSDIALAIDTHQPDVIVNAAAYTAVDDAENDAELAYLVNAEAVGEMAAYANEAGIPLIHISTDFVFDGAKDSPYTEEDEAEPLSVYGASKLAGEALLQAHGGPHIILRVSWVFSEHGSNYVKTMLKLGAERDALKIVDDQIGGPTSAADIAGVCMQLAARAVSEDAPAGIYHFAGAPDVSRADFTWEILSQAGLRAEVTGIPSRDFPLPAERPLNSRLDCSKLEKVFGIERPDWRKALGRVLDELGELKANG
ncbi:dTDP-4-dehydrorhamnose reductase [Ponticaulis sp.]|uniref:dTDP-4-dehydrorhamnose reductase n=1 Tax=Ponticaulis sp. TaxID=2020902 RepID=UPI000B739395|nr:dTDP-4-dehydrorhamnose reductase [Ponticaulis sp.]MAI91827.1 dTDP-4-dehydrorhamnose reductase [Ponticaulis sp.]OUX96698.1 MAG: dTDP-4-dehydrorhamnose reductase [Hyphomonadaceae bacterium TMED5]|tara:strand:- start:26380 stop:27240 length:861 start_codon:yes stop_codon:yes gene_type:complete